MVNDSFSGMQTPPSGLPDATLNEVERSGQVFGEYVFARGYRGVCDVDGGVTPTGYYVTETNFRRTGGTYIDALLRRLVGENYLSQRVWVADSRKARAPIAFIEGIELLERAGLAFDRETKTGVLVTADTLGIDHKWRYLVIANSLAEAATIERGAQDVLKS